MTVVVAVRDGARYIDRTLHSAREQTFADFEVIVVDDSSTDATVEIVERHAAADGRIRLVASSEQGVAAARNRGIDDARGQIVALLDADDIWHPGHLASHMTRFDRDPTLAGVWSPPLTIDESDHIIDEVLPFDRATIENIEGWILLPLLYRFFPACASTLTLRRSVLVAMGGFDQDQPVSEDFAMMLRIAEHGRLGVAPQPLVGYRQVPGSRSSRASINVTGQLATMREIEERIDWLPRRVRRWARAGRYVAASARSMWAGDRRLGVRFGLHATMLDPAVLLHPQAIPSVARYLLRRSRRHTALHRFPEDAETFTRDAATRRGMTYGWWATVEDRRHRWMARYERDARGELPT